MIFICEIGSNHLGDLGRAKEMVHAVADCGAQIAKFQLFKPEQYPHNVSTPKNWLTSLTELCSKLGIGLLCSYFYIPVVRPALVKIAYSQRHNFDLIRGFEEARTKLIVSGDNNTWWPENCIKLACVPKYPAEEKDYDFMLCGKYLRDYDGISDHTRGVNLIDKYKPKWIEKHFKLGDEGNRSPDAGDFATTPKELKTWLKQFV